MKRRIAVVLATWFGAGYSPIAPGTAGSLVALFMARILHNYAGAGPWTFAVLCAVFFLPAVWAARETAIAVKKKDPGIVVIDEVLGQWLTLAGASTLNWESWLFGFILFRLFDIWKPAPVRQLERLPGGWGIIADDVMAGVYGALVLMMAGWFNLY